MMCGNQACYSSHLRGRMSVLAIVFVGQCEVFVCLGFVSLFLLFPFSLGREAHRSADGVPIPKKC